MRSWREPFAKTSNALPVGVNRGPLTPMPARPWSTWRGRLYGSESARVFITPRGLLALVPR